VAVLQDRLSGGAGADPGDRLDLRFGIHRHRGAPAGGGRGNDRCARGGYHPAGQRPHSTTGEGRCRMTDRQEQLILTDETLNTHFAEAYRSLRANISFSSIDRSVKTMLVTSASPQEGKTTTVINLGIIMAQAGPRVMIVDADFRRPSLHHIFGFLPNGKKTLPGLSNLIVGNSTLKDVLLPSGFARVSLVPAGIVPPNPNELLSSQRMRAVIEELGE